MANVTASKTVVGNSIAVNAGDTLVRRLPIRAVDIVNAGTFADNDTATFQIPIKAGEAVESVSVKLVKAFTDSGSGDELNVEIGDRDDPNGFVASAQLHSGDTPISYVANTGAYFVAEAGDTDPANATNFKLYISDNAINVLITPNISTGTDYSLNELTAGEIVVKVFYKDLN